MRRKPLFPPPQDAGSGKKLRNKGRQPRHVLTIIGRVKLLRRWWHSAATGSVAPADSFIDPEMHSLSPGVREMACRLNNDGTSFDRTAENLRRTALIGMSGEQLRQVVLSEGRHVLAVQQANAIPTAFQAKDCLTGEGRTRIYTGCDGVMVPLITDAEKQRRRKKVCEKRQKCGRKRRPLPPRKRGADLAFKEFKTIVFYDETGKHWHQVLSRGKRRVTGALLRREAQRLGFRWAEERIANVDGAVWIRNQLEEQPLPLSGLGLDFYHLGENVHRCRRAVFGETASEGEAWATDLMHSFKHAGYEPTWEKLVASRSTFRNPRKRAAVDRLLNYVSERRDMINYPEFLAKGWQIGSGPTESRCKTSTSRLKGRGRRWDAANAEAVAALTTLQDSRQWPLYWGTACGQTT